MTMATINHNDNLKNNSDDDSLSVALLSEGQVCSQEHSVCVGESTTNSTCTSSDTTDLTAARTNTSIGGTALAAGTNLSRSSAPQRSTSLNQEQQQGLGGRGRTTNTIDLSTDIDALAYSVMSHTLD